LTINGKTANKLCPVQNFLSAGGAIPTSSAGTVYAAVFGVGGGYFSLVFLISFLFLHNFFEGIDDFS
jgi:hypothetical protein